MTLLTLLRGNARWIGGGFVLLLLSSFGQTFFIALSAGDIRREYGLSHGGFAALYMAATLLSALTLPRLGPVADRHSATRLVRLAVPMLALAAGLMALSTHIGLLLVALYLLRLFGQGLMTHIAFTALSRWFLAQRGQALSLATLGMNAGEALFPLAFVSLAAVLGWRGAWGAGALGLLLLALPLVAALTAVERQPARAELGTRRTAGRDWTRAEVLRDPLFYWVMAAMIPPALIGNTVFFHQLYLAELRGWPAQLFASAFALMAAMTVLCSLLAGRRVDRSSATALLPVYLLPMGLGCLLLGGAEGGWVVWVFMALFGLSNGCSLALFGTLWPEIYGLAHLGAVRAMIVAVLVFVSAVGPGSAGLLIDLGLSYPALLLALGGYCLAVSLTMRAAVRRLRQRSQACAQEYIAQAPASHDPEPRGSQPAGDRPS
ncbi:MFS transporter [Paucibacter sp. XJ19-41]|uniref:MFS transporter n=1 Tax=Paucibacter sp. XJ19-41 TaxID=2927824 RepID=UPI002348F17A|nr:MFS transporter [Paucibacter sp. XJ19-41]MDC6167061.1 MFS transporter [Paucibacter sp. XJ19-41]